MAPNAPNSFAALPTPDWDKHALFLDFDGTLAPIVDRPEDARPAAETLDLLNRLAAATQGAVAILSGRALADLARQLGSSTLSLSGSHGLEIRLPDGDILPAGRPKGGLDAAFVELSPLATEAGLLIENKPGSIALHYRNRPADAATFKRHVDVVAERHGLRVLHGHMVSEAALRGMNKGVALRLFMDQREFTGRLPIMVGDDITDEDGFRMAQDMGGFGLRIGAVKSIARYQVPEMENALSWLAQTLGSAPA